MSFFQCSVLIHSLITDALYYQELTGNRIILLKNLTFNKLQMCPFEYELKEYCNNNNNKW